MKYRAGLRLIPCVIALACAASAVHALSLGRARGVALIGRPIDIGVQLSLEGNADPAGECVHAEVFQGDSRVAASGVAAALDTSSRGDALLRIRSSTVVEEAVLTVYVRAGCLQPVTRRYVFLSELPGDMVAAPLSLPTAGLPVAAPLAPASVPSVVRLTPQAARAGGGARGTGQPPAAQAESSAATVAGARAGSQSSRATAPADTASSAASGPRLRSERAVAAGARAEQGAPVLARKPVVARARARLVLEPFDLAAERDPVLKSSPTLPEPAEASAQQRAQAAALWKAINARPEDVLRDAQSLGALEADLKTLRDQVRATNASVAALRGQLEQARAERYANGVVYGLVVLLALALGGGYFLWRRERDNVANNPAWWKAVQEDDEDDTPKPVAAKPRASSPGTLSASVAPGPASGSATAQAGGATDRRPRVPEAPEVPEHHEDDGADVDLDLSMPGPLEPSGAGLGPNSGGWSHRDSDFQASQPASMRSVKAEELHDVQQQADFFVSLGQHDQAIQVLNGHIAAHPTTSPMAWLDLLELYHNLDRRSDYEMLRREFQRTFNVRVPAYDHYLKPRTGLEGHPAALARIVALWPSPKVLDVIEDAIFRAPEGDGAEAFGLETYRDLLLLYNVGKETLVPSIGLDDFRPSAAPAARRPDFGNTDMSPLDAGTPLRELVEPSGPGELTALPDVALDDSAADLDIDIDLDIDLEGLPPVPTVSSSGDAAGAESGTADLAAQGAAAAAPDSNLLDFDAFDSATARFSLGKRPR